MSFNFLRKIFFFLLGLSLASVSQAAPIYEGFLTDSSGSPITTPVLIRLTLQGINGCALYEEVASVTPDPEGHFSVKLGTGTNGVTVTVIDFAGGPAAAMSGIDRAFENRGTFTSSRSCYYEPAPQDGRKLAVAVSNDSGANWDSLGVVQIEASSYALSAGVAESVGGFKPINLLRVSGTAPDPLSPSQFESLFSLSGLNFNNGQVPVWMGAGWSVLSFPTCALGEALSYDGSTFVCVSSGGDIGAGGGTGSGTVTNVTGSSPISVTDGTTAPVISISPASDISDGYLSSTDWQNFNNKLSNAVTSITAGPGLWGGTITSSGMIGVDVGTGPFQIVQMDSDGRLPWSDGSNLQNVNAQKVAGMNFNAGFAPGDFIQAFYDGSELKFGPKNILPTNPCSSNQVLTFAYPSDRFSCVNQTVPKQLSPVMFYVRSDGSPMCDGLSNAAYVNSGTSCAKSSIKDVLESLPEYINATVTINISTDIVSSATTAISKVFGEQGHIQIFGNSNTITSAFQGGPVFTVFSMGMVSGQAPSVEIWNLNLSNSNAAGTSGVGIMSMGALRLENVSMTNISKGLVVHSGYVQMQGPISFSLPSGAGEGAAIQVDGGGSVVHMGSGLSITLNGGTYDRQAGISVNSGGSFGLQNGSLTINMSPLGGSVNTEQSVGLRAAYGGRIELKGTGTSNINANSGTGNLPIEIAGGEIFVGEGASLNLTDITGSTGLRATGGSIHCRGYFYAAVASQSAESSLINLDLGAKATFTNHLATNGGSASLIKAQSGSIFKFSPAGTNKVWNANRQTGTTTKLVTASTGAVVEIGNEFGATYQWSNFGGTIAEALTGATIVMKGSMTNGGGPLFSSMQVTNDSSGRFVSSATDGPKPMYPEHGIYKATYSSSWTVPLHVKSVKVTVVGAGGSSYGTFAGGKGARAYAYMPVNPGGQVNVTVGSSNGAGSSFETNVYGSIHSISADGGGAATISYSGADGTIQLMRNGTPATDYLELGPMSYGAGGIGSIQPQNGVVIIEW